MNTKPASLIMCTTPLQMLIAERIIKLFPKHNFDLILVTPHHNDKFQFYFERLSSHCLNTLYYTPYNGLKSYADIKFRFRKYLKKSNLNKKYENVFLASIDSLYFQYILSIHSSANIFTFDDGTANISIDSIYMKPTNNKFIKKIMSSLIGNKFDMLTIKSNSLLHYTIYNNIPNIIDKTSFIKLFDDDVGNQSNLIKKSINIFLGQPLGTIDKTLEQLDIVKLTKSLNIDYYFPHPREKIQNLYDIEIINSNLIFEDFIIEYLMKNKDNEVNVYSFISSANLNIAHLDRINNYFIYNPILYKLYSNFYTLAKGDFNIPIINLD